MLELMKNSVPAGGQLALAATWEAKETINAGVDGKQFFLQTGGDTVQETKLHDTIERNNADAKEPEVPAADSEK